MIVQKILYFVHLIKTMFWRKVSETIKNTLIKIGVGVLSLLFMLCIYRSYTLYGNGELGMNYMLGNGIAFFLLFLTIISLCAAVIFIIIGLIKKIRKVAAKSFITSIILFLTSVISILIFLFTISKVTNIEEEYQAIQVQKKKKLIT